MADGESVDLPETVEQAAALDKLRTWFERELGKSRGEED
jgi:hypothetical protein